MSVPVFSFHFVRPSIPHVLLPPTLIPHLSLFHWESYRVPMRPNQFSDESSSVSRGPGLHRWNSLTTFHTYTHSALMFAHRPHTPPAYARWKCIAITWNLFTIFTHPNSTRPNLSEVAANVFCREEAWLVESWPLISINENCFGEVSFFLSFFILQAITSGWYWHWTFRVQVTEGGQAERWRVVEEEREPVLFGELFIGSTLLCHSCKILPGFISRGISCSSTFFTFFYVTIMCLHILVFKRYIKLSQPWN